MKAQHHSTTFTSQDIERYLNKQMTPEEMHAMEKAALDDPFLADAMEGYAEVGDTGVVQSFSSDLSELESRLKERVSPATKDQKVIPFNTNRWWRVAAGIMLIAGTAGLVYTVMNTAESSADKQIAKKESAAATSPSNSSRTDDTSVSRPAAPMVQDNAMNRQAAPPPTMSENESISPKAESQDEADVTAKLKDSDAGLLQQERVGEASARTREAKAQRGDNDKQATIASAPAARQQSEVVVGQARNNAKELAPFAGNNFNGKVVDQDNKPIAGATVMVENKNIGVSTDENGQFNMIVPDSNIKVNIASVGFEPASITLKYNLVDNRIVLKQSNEPLSDVVVTGYGTRRKKSVFRNRNAATTLVPAAGWDAYETYLSKNKRKPAGDTASGEVIISFSTNKAGKPTNLKIERSLRSALDAEALRLVKEGPAWKPAKSKVRGRVTINF